MPERPLVYSLGLHCVMVITFQHIVVTVGGQHSSGDYISIKYELI